jgi:hypothetical protein
MHITGFIQNLILKNQPMEAIRFIYAFEMVNQFPPGPILRDYLSGSKIAARKIKRRSKSIEGLVCFAGFLLQYVNLFSCVGSNCYYMLTLKTC